MARVRIVLLVHLFGFVLHLVSGQAVPRCVPRGHCFTQGTSVNPRIGDTGTTNPTSCGTGFDLCYPSDVPVTCGTRNVPVSTANGPTEMGSHPWQVYMMNQTGRYMGSGVLLTDRVLLTAAHKVYQNVDSPGNVKIYVGVNNPMDTAGINQPPAEMRSAANIYIHENFMTTPELDYKNDIALVLLDSPLIYGYRVDLNTGCLPRNTDSFVGQNCTVAGWGETEFQSQDDGRLHKQVQVNIVSMSTCQASMEQANVLGTAATAKFLDTQRELCAGGAANRDACTNDGGAPLMCYNSASQRYVVAGLVIWGKGCGRAGVYGVYVDVAKYVDWINSNISLL